MEVEIKKKICQYLSEVLVEMPEEELLKIMEIPPEEKMGDFALPCFILAKNMHKNPLQIASELAEKLNEQKDELGIEKAENAGAYCNIYLKRDLFVRKCFEILEKDKYGAQWGRATNYDFWVVMLSLSFMCCVATS